MDNSINVDKLILEGRKQLTLTGVVSVDAFSEQVLKLTANSGKITVLGTGIKITAFNKQTGLLNALGCINEIKYIDKKPPLAKRIFK